MAADTTSEAKKSLFAQIRDHVRERFLPNPQPVEVTAPEAQASGHRQGVAPEKPSDAAVEQVLRATGADLTDGLVVSGAYVDGQFVQAGRHLPHYGELVWGSGWTTREDSQMATWAERQVVYRNDEGTYFSGSETIHQGFGPSLEFSDRSCTNFDDAKQRALTSMVREVQNALAANEGLSAENRKAVAGIVAEVKAAYGDLAPPTDLEHSPAGRDAVSDMLRRDMAQLNKAHGGERERLMREMMQKIVTHEGYEEALRDVSPKIASDVVLMHRLEEWRMREQEAQKNPFVNLTWRGDWEISTDGRYEVRPIAYESADGFVVGYESSERGVEGPTVFRELPWDTLEQAQAAAEAFAFERLREYEAPLQYYPEVGKTYRGTVISITDADLVQAVEGQHFRHERHELSGPQGVLSPGSKVEIRYPANRVGIVREWGAVEMRTGASKGLEPKGFG